MERKEFNFRGRRLVYRTKGSGPLVVLLHGFGEEGSVWRAQSDLFHNHQLLIPDLPGSGDSEAIDDMSMESLADAVKELVDSIQLGERITLIGHSMGGYIALAFAEKYPDSLSAFGLFHSTAFPDSDEKRETRRKGIRFIQEHGAFEFLKTATPNLFAPKTKVENGGLIDEQLATVRNFSAENLVSYYEAMMKRPDRTEVLRNSQVPVLFVLGKYDAAVPIEDGWKLCHLPQLSYIHHLENSGHMGMLEEVNETNQLLTQFVTQK